MGRRTYQTKPDMLTPKRARRDEHVLRYAILEAGQDIPVSDCLVGVDKDGYVLPASEYASVSDFIAEYAGVCPMAYEAADHDRVIVITAAGNYEFDVAAGTYPAGLAVGPVLNSGGTAVENRKVAAIADTNSIANTIGAVAAHAPESGNWKQASGATSVEVDIYAPRMIEGWAPAPA